MIQRIQSIFMFLAGMSGVSAVFLPFATTGQDTSFAELQDGVYNAFDNHFVFGIFVLVAIVALVNIFLFKSRPTQLLINTLTMLVTLVGIGLMAYPFLGFLEANMSLVQGLGAWAALLICLFLMLANRGIRKDSRLVKSMDSLR